MTENSTSDYIIIDSSLGLHTKLTFIYYSSIRVDVKTPNDTSYDVIEDVELRLVTVILHGIVVSYLFIKWKDSAHGQQALLAPTANMIHLVFVTLHFYSVAMSWRSYRKPPSHLGVEASSVSVSACMRHVSDESLVRILLYSTPQ